MIFEDYWFYQLELASITSAIECGVFTGIQKGEHSAQQLATELALKKVALVPLLNCMVNLKLLIKNGDKYTNSEESALLLDRSSRFYRGDYFVDTRKLPLHDRLVQFLKTGNAPLTENGKSMSEMIERVARALAPLAWAALGERPGSLAWCGFALTVAGGLMVGLARTQRP